MKTDILSKLRAVLLENTTAYQSDFEYDVAVLLKAAKQPTVSAIFMVVLTVFRLKRLK